MACHLSEDIAAAKVLDNLADNEAVVTSNYKMKILSCFLQEPEEMVWKERDFLAWFYDCFKCL